MAVIINEKGVSRELIPILHEINRRGCWFKRENYKVARKYYYGERGDESNPVPELLGKYAGRSRTMELLFDEDRMTGIVILTGKPVDNPKRTVLIKKPESQAKNKQRRCIGCHEKFSIKYPGNWRCSDCEEKLNSSRNGNPRVLCTKGIR